MCGRFTLRAPASVIAEQFSLFEMPRFSPMFNIAPTQAVAVVREASEGNRSGRELVWMHWGLIPSWAKEKSVGSRTINARAETAAQKPSFRAAMRRRRCLIPADGFYEWQRGDGRKQPYFIHRADDRPFALAGLWETWEGPEANYLESCAILTTSANELMQPLHDRMPVILPPEQYAPWLDPAVQDPAAAEPLLRPYSGGDLEAYPVSTYVNSPTHDSPACTEPLKALF